MVCVLVTSLGLPRLSITSDNRSFFDTDDTHYKNLIEFENQFSPYSTAVFLITSELPIDQSDSHKSAHLFLTSIAGELPFVKKVDSLATFPVVHAQGDEVVVGMLLEENCTSTRCEAQLVPDKLNQSTILNRLISVDNRTSAVLASFIINIEENTKVQTITNAIDDDVRKAFATKYPELQLHVTGGVPMMQAFATAAAKDLSSLIPLAGVLLLAVLWIVLGGTYLASAMVLLGVSTCAITLGIAGWFGLVLNSATSSIPTVIFSLTIASTMHLFLHLARGRDVHGADSLPLAFRSAVSANAVPTLMTIGTTVVGMLSLLTVPSPPVRDLGIWVAIGLIIGCILTFTALPASLSFRYTIPVSNFARHLQTWFNRYAKRIESNGVSITPFLLFFFVAIIGLTQLEIDDDFVSYFDSSSTFRKDTDYATQALSGPYGIELIVAVADDQTIFSTEVFQYLFRLKNRLAEDEIVKSAISIHDILDAVKDDIHPNHLPLELASNDYLAQLFLAYDFSLQKDQSTADFVDFAHQSTRVSVVLNASTSKDTRMFIESIEAWHNESAGKSFQLTITGESVPTAYLSPANINAMAFGILFSLLCSAAVIGIYYRSLRVAVIALISILVPVLIGFGIWGWIYGSIGLAATVIVAITIGVVIDDSIHMIVRAKDGYENLDLNGSDAAAYAIYRVGIAIVGTTLVLVGAFSILLFSGFELNSAFGMCTALILTSAMAFDLIVLPRLISWALDSEAA
jgi:predicted RND superfamily exporter protein